jgi:two-component system sensor histidine kinase RegB
VQLTATRAHLWQVFWARNVVIAALCLWIALVSHELPSPWAVSLLGLAALVNALTWLRLRRPAPVSYGEFLIQILCDVLLIGAGLHHSGGNASTLADLSFVPLTIAAATLPWRQTLVVYLAIFGLHELVCHFLPTYAWPDPAERRTELLAGGLIACFVYSMARGSRLHEALLVRMREKYFAQRHAAELGTLAASAVHELSSPLATLAVVVNELRGGAGGDAEQRRALDVMASQIENCKRINSRLLAWAGHERVEGGGRVAADSFIAAVVEKCRLMQPWVALEHRRGGSAPPPQIVADSSLEQAILVLLHCSPGALRQIEISYDWSDTELQIHLCDFGPVSTVYADDQAGTPLFAARPPPESKHFDLLMAKAAIERFGGRMEERRHAEGVVCMELSIPLSNLKVTRGNDARP